MKPSALLRPLVYLWAFPATLLGLLFVPISLFDGGVHLVDGVLEVHGRFVSRFLSDWSLLKGGASAMTLGHVVIGRDELLLDLTRSHERVHVRQYERWGPLFIPAYLGCSLALWAMGRQGYRDNPFEREAYGS